MAAEVFGVEVDTVNVPHADAFTIHIGALWSAPAARNPKVEYRAIDITLRGVRDVDGSQEDAHVFNVLFDALEGLLRRRSLRRARLSIAQARELELAAGPPSSIRPRLAPEFTEALPSEIPPPDEPDK